MFNAQSFSPVSTGFTSGTSMLPTVSNVGVGGQLQKMSSFDTMQEIFFDIRDGISNLIESIKNQTGLLHSTLLGVIHTLTNIGSIVAKDLDLEEKQTNIDIENEKDEDKDKSLSDDNEGKGLLTNSFKGGVAKVMQRIKDMSLVESLIALGVGLSLLMFNFEKVAGIIGKTVKFFDEHILPRIKAFGSSLGEYYTNLFDGLFGDNGFFTVIFDGFANISEAIDKGDGKAALAEAANMLIKGTTSAISVIGTTVLGAIKVIAKTIDPEADLSDLDEIILFFNDLVPNAIKKLEKDQLEFDKVLKEEGKLSAAGVLFRQTYDNYIANTLNGISNTLGFILKPFISDETYEGFMKADYSFANIKSELNKAFDNLGEVFDKMKDSVRVFSNGIIDSVNSYLPDFMQIKKIPKKDDQFEIDTLDSMEKQKLITPKQYESGGFMYDKYQEQREKVIAIDPSVVIPNNDFERDFGVDANVGDLIERKDNIMSLKTKELKDVASVSKSDSSTSIVVPNFITDNKKIDNSSNSSQSVTVTDQRVESLDSSSNALLAYFRQ
jgi:hypothetical protein